MSARIRVEIQVPTARIPILIQTSGNPNRSGTGELVYSFPLNTKIAAKTVTANVKQSLIFELDLKGFIGQMRSLRSFFEYLLANSKHR